VHNLEELVIPMLVLFGYHKNIIYACMWVIVYAEL
jgi:hypothetical protein